MASSCAQSPSLLHPRNQRTQTKQELAHQSPSRSPGSMVREGPVLTPFYQKWPRARVLRLKPAPPPALPHTCDPSPYTPPAASSKQDGFEAPLGLQSVGTFSINKPFFTPNPDALRYSLWKHWSRNKPFPGWGVGGGGSSLICCSADAPATPGTPHNLQRRPQHQRLECPRRARGRQ